MKVKSIKSHVVIFIILTFTLNSSIGYSKNQGPQKIPELEPNYQPSPKDFEFYRHSATGERWTFKELPRDLGGSIKESFWGWGGLAFGLGAAATGVAYPFDEDLQNSFEKDHLFGHTGNEIIGWTFSPYTLAGGSVLTWIVGYATKSPKAEMTGRALTESLFLSLGITAAGKFAFRRTRPDGGSLSFPSAHSTAAFSTAGVLTTLYGWKAGIPTYSMAALVAVSRVDHYKHFLSDVLMGAVIGTVIGVGTAKYHRKKNPHLFISPYLDRENAGVQFLYVF